ncbi:MAG: class I SAM-dependent methyltransferase [Planctomycetota bacterium]
MSDELNMNDKLYINYLQSEWRLSYSHIYALWKKRKLVFRMMEKEFCRKKEDWHILDAGCGNGEYLFWLNEYFGGKYRLFFDGADLSAGSIETAAKRVVSQNNTNFNFRVADIEKTKFADGIENKYDVVICLETLEHLKFPETALENIKKVTKPNGLIIMTTPDNYSFTTRLEQYLRALKKKVKKNGGCSFIDIAEIIKITKQFFSGANLPQLSPAVGYGHISEKSTAEWIKLCRAAGLKVMQIKRTNLFFGGDFFDRHPFWFGVILWIDTLLDYLPLSRWFCWEHILMMRK